MIPPNKAFHISASCSLCKRVLKNLQVADFVPALKEQVRLSKGKPGQFLLSGSVRFTGTPKIRESLTGRIANVELLPLSISEPLELENPEVYTSLIETDEFEQSNLEELLYADSAQSKKKDKALGLYLEQGGMPGICFIREPKIRIDRIKYSLETILDRDLRQLVKTNLPYQTILRLTKNLAQHMGAPLDFLKLSKETDISRPSLQKLIFAMENTFILRLIKIEGSRRGFGYFFEDLAEARFLSDGLGSSNILSHAIWMNARAALSYTMGYPHEFFQFYSRSGQISICIRKGTATLGILCLKEPMPSRKELGVCQSFLKEYKNSKVCLVHREAEVKAIDSRSALIPAHALL